MLEVAQGPLCIRPKDTVDLPRVEAEVVQPALQFGDILAPCHRPAVVEEAVTEHVAGFVQRAPGVGTDDPVGIETPRLLEATHGINRHLSITALWVPVGRESERAEARPDIAHCFAGVTQSIEPHRRIVTGSSGLG